MKFELFLDKILNKIILSNFKMISFNQIQIQNLIEFDKKFLIEFKIFFYEIHKYL